MYDIIVVLIILCLLSGRRLPRRGKGEDRKSVFVVFVIYSFNYTCCLFRIANLCLLPLLLICSIMCLFA